MTPTMLPLPPDLSRSKTLRPLLEKAGEWVAELIAQYEWPTPVSVEWYRIANNPREELVGVRVSDEYTAANGLFHPSELGTEDAVLRQFNPVLRALIGSSLDEQQRRFRATPTGVA